MSNSENTADPTVRSEMSGECRFRREATSRHPKAPLTAPTCPRLARGRSAAQPVPTKLDASAFASISVNLPIRTTLPPVIGASTTGEDTMRPWMTVAISF